MFSTVSVQPNFFKVGRHHEVSVVVQIVGKHPDEKSESPEDEANHDQDKDSGYHGSNDDPPFWQWLGQQLTLVGIRDGAYGQLVVGHILRMI